MTSKDEESDEKRRKLLKPAPTIEQVLDAIKLNYTKPDSETNVTIAEELVSYDDRNYLITIDGVKYLAKVHNGVESDDYFRSREKNLRNSVIDLQNAMFHHLTKHDIGTSYPIPTISNSDECVHTFPVISSTHSPRKLVLKVLRWVEGRTMESARTLPIESLAEAGSFLGKTCLALDQFQDEGALEAAKRYHIWDGKNTTDLKEFVDCIDDPDRKKLVQSVISEFDQKLSNGTVEFRLGLLVADFNDGNIIIENGQGGKVVGVIDFGDSVYSWRVLDISIAMAYAMLSSYAKPNHSLAAAAAMLRGFHRVYPLTDTERKYLRLLIACRLSCSGSLGAYSYKQNPENEYLLLHSQSAWDALKLIWSGDCDSEDIQRLFDVACDHVGKDDKKKKVIDCSDIALPDPYIVDLLRSSRARVLSSSPLSKKQKVSEDDTVLSTITFVTGNKKKLEEVQRILCADGVDLPFKITNHKLDLPELQGDPADIAKEKCVLAVKELNGAVITEDTSLCFNALNGMPGPYIKWFLEKCGHDGLNKLLAGYEDKSAYAQTIVAFCARPGEEVRIFDGRTKGKIVPPRGSKEFGWDPIFEPDEGDGKTYAEMEKEEKDSISHRSRAFALLKTYLMENLSALTGVA